LLLGLRAPGPHRSVSPQPTPPPYPHPTRIPAHSLRLRRPTPNHPRTVPPHGATMTGVQAATPACKGAEAIVRFRTQAGTLSSRAQG